MNTKWFTPAESLIINTIIQVIGIPDAPWEKVVRADDAHVIFIYHDRVELLKQYREDKIFCYISTRKEEVNLPQNVVHVNALNAIDDTPKLVQLIKEFKPTTKPVKLHKQPAQVEETKARRLRVLVIDDRPENIVFAQALLGARHNITVTERFETAMELLKSETFDYVLTDLELPGSLYYRALGPERIDMTATYHYGLLIAFEATRRNLPVAIVTDGNHHDSWLSAAFDEFKIVIINDKPVRIFNDIGKRWDIALKELEQLSNPS